jgi:hypothetical protein
MTTEKRWVPRLAEWRWFCVPDPHDDGRDYFAESDRFRERLDEEFRAKAAAKAAQQKAEEAKQLLAAVYREEPAAMERWVLQILRERKATVTWLPAWRWNESRAILRRHGRSHLYLPRPDSHEALVVVLHELAHDELGWCSGRGLHRRVPGGGGCLACESAAWSRVEKLLPGLPLVAFRRRQAALSSYRRAAAVAPAAVRKHAAALVSSRHWAEEKQRRLKQQMRAELVERWKREMSR